MSNTPKMLTDLAADLGGKVEDVQYFPDGTGGATISYPLPSDHWSLGEKYAPNIPAMPFRMGSDDFATVAVFPNAGWPDRSARFTREEMAETIRAAGRYAYRCATLNGTEPDMDPDALLQSLVVGLLGYWTATGYSADADANPHA